MIGRFRWTWILVAGAAAVVTWLALVVARDAAEFPLFAGRFHPLVVHLPIGSLIAAATLALASKSSKALSVRPAVVFLLVFCAAGTLLSVITGQLLASTGIHAGAALDWHATAGYGVALLAMLTAVVAWSERGRDPARAVGMSDVLIAATVLLAVVTGHLGGNLSRGPGYLTEYVPRSIKAWLPGVGGSHQTAVAVQPRDVVIYTALVAPILQERCVPCHGPEAKGGLRLDTPEGIGAGGDSGATVIAGHAAGSELVRRIWLPPTHPDAMPPRGRVPLPVAEAGVLRWWIDEGASFERTLADIQAPRDLLPAIEARVGVLQASGPAILSIDVPAVDPATLEALIERGIPVAPLSDRAAFLQVQARGAGRAFGNDEVAALQSVAAQVTWLDLGGTAVTDEAMATIARFPHLSRLHLDRTAVTDDGLARLGALEHLEYLNLYGTSVTDEGVKALTALPRLRTLYLWQTAVTADGIAAIETVRPGIAINAGEPSNADDENSRE